MKRTAKKKVMKKMVSKDTIDSLFTDDEFSLIRFYENVAQEFGVPVAENTMYDCRKVVVADNIMTHWYEECKKIYGKDGIYELTRLFLLCGPKAAEHLGVDEIEVEEGYAQEKSA